jgi:zinc transporter
MPGFKLKFSNGVISEVGADDPVRVNGDGFIWEHIETPGDIDLSLTHADLQDVVLAALVASETRPRCEQIDDGALVNLRGLAAEPDGAGDRLVSVRAWVHRGHVISVSRRPLAATNRVEQAMRARKISDPGDLVAAFAQEISNGLDPEIARLGDEVDDCESAVDEGSIYRLRTSIAAARSQAIAYRRFIAPNRDALLALAALDVEWLAQEDRLHIREAADRFARMAEELEAVRERSALLHEQLTDLRSELIDQRSLVIAIVAFIFLPLTFVTGLLGMNVQGIPFAHEHWAFWGVVAFCVLIGLIVFGWFALRHWIKR